MNLNCNISGCTIPGLLVAVWLAMAAFVATGQTTNRTGFAAFEMISQRNIFNQSRMPHQRIQPPPRVPDAFSLVGTLFYAEGDIAFFDGTSSEFRKALKVGGDIAGFKVTHITLNSVTLSQGTNQTVLKIAMQMRRDDDGHWSELAGSVSSVGYASSAMSGRSYSSRSHSQGSSQRAFAATTEPVAMDGENNDSASNGMEEPPPPPEADGSDSAPDTVTSPPGGANNALSRLMQRRAQQEQRLRQRQ